MPEPGAVYPATFDFLEERGSKHLCR